MSKTLKKASNIHVKEYEAATGNHFKKDKDFFSTEYIDWSNKREEEIKKYIIVLKQQMGITLNESITEVGKTSLDSIVIKNDKPHIITPYAEDFLCKNDVKNSKFIINTKGNVVDYNGVLKCDNSLDFYSRFGRIITQNPYNQNCIKNWDKIHNNGGEITIGVFGNVNDLDRSEKVKQIDDIRNKFDDDILYSYNTFDDIYFAVLSSFPNSNEIRKEMKYEDVFFTQKELYR